VFVASMVISYSVASKEEVRNKKKKKDFEGSKYHLSLKALFLMLVTG
jgi:hypothetical protein